MNKKKIRLKKGKELCEIWLHEETGWRSTMSRLLRQPTRLQAAIHSRSQIDREVGPPSVNVSAPNCVRETQSSVDNVGRKHKEVCSDIAAARILVAQSSNEDGRRTGRVLLVMNAALGEHRCLELPQLRLNLGVKSVLLHKSSVQNPIYHSKDFVRTGMEMWDVEPTRLDERKGTGDTELFEDGEVVDGGKKDGAAFSTSGRGLVVEIENRQLAKSGTGKEISVAICQQLLEAVVDAGLRLEPCGDGRSIGNSRDWAGCSHSGCCFD